MDNVKGKQFFKNLLGFREGTILLIILFIAVIISFLSPNFLTMSNIRALSVGFSLEGIAVVGMAYAIISKGLDLSIGAVLALSGIITGRLFVMGVNIWIAAIIGILAAALCGLFNGFLIGKIGLDAFIATLGTMGIARGLVFVITEGTPIPLISKLPSSFAALGGGKIGPIPVLVIIFLIIIIIADILLRKASSFRKIYYTGSNESAAKLSGINTVLIKYGVYIGSAALAGIAGVISTARFGVASPIIGSEMALVLISGAVIGGCSFSGGEGSVLGAVLGVILLAMVTNVLILLNVSIYYQQLISGVILVIAVTIDHVRNKRLELSVRKLRK